MKRLLSADVLTILKGFPEPVRDFFLSKLFALLKSGDFCICPLSDDMPTRLARDDKGFIRIIWNPEVVTAALAAAQRYRDILAVQGRLSFRMGNSDAESYHKSGSVN
ncbi:MAG TPA: hypothetical protein VNF02_03800 [Candidatus Limnocylindrales bacterium]|nr:hypothetical protein [Candidatus Limnocylindrales bacterium]